MNSKPTEADPISRRTFLRVTAALAAEALLTAACGPSPKPGSKDYHPYTIRAIPGGTGHYNFTGMLNPSYALSQDQKRSILYTDMAGEIGKSCERYNITGEISNTDVLSGRDLLGVNGNADCSKGIPDSWK